MCAELGRTQPLTPSPAGALRARHMVAPHRRPGLDLARTAHPEPPPHCEPQAQVRPPDFGLPLCPAMRSSTGQTALDTSFYSADQGGGKQRWLEEEWAALEMVGLSLS